MNRTLSYKEGNALGTLWTIRFSRRNLSVNMILATETSTCCNWNTCEQSLLFHNTNNLGLLATDEDWHLFIPYDTITYSYFVASKTANAKNEVQCAESEVVSTWTLRNNHTWVMSKTYWALSLTSCLQCCVLNKISNDTRSWLEIPNGIELITTHLCINQLTTKLDDNESNSVTVTDFTCFPKQTRKTVQYFCNISLISVQYFWHSTWRYRQNITKLGFT